MIKTNLQTKPEILFHMLAYKILTNNKILIHRPYHYIPGNLDNAMAWSNLPTIKYRTSHMIQSQDFFIIKMYLMNASEFSK